MGLFGTKEQPRHGSLAFDLSANPPIPTAVRTRLSGGRVISSHPGGGMWLYRRVPMAPMTSAKSDSDRVSAGGTLFAAYNEVAEFSKNMGGRRGLSKNSYRETHLLWVNVPVHYNPGQHPNSRDLLELMGHVEINRRVLLFGVRVMDSLNSEGSGGLKGIAKSVAEQWQYRTIPVEAFNKDVERLDAALARAGLEVPSPEEFRLADAWWNNGHAPDTPFLPHLDHMHVFRDTASMRAAEKVGRDHCFDWKDMGVHVNSLSFASVADIDFQYEHPASFDAMWAMSLFSKGAMAISVRGQVEPAEVTRGELRRNHAKYEDDIRERFEAGKMRKAEQERHLANLGRVEAEYATGGTPTLIDASVVVAFSGTVGDMEQLSGNLPGLKMQPLAKRQPNAWGEMLLASTIRANPNGHDLPIQTIAHAGFQSLAEVGDDPMGRRADGRQESTALLGFTELDKQPSYLSASAASAADGFPLMLIAGSTGSGKTMVLLWLAKQLSRQDTPIILVDPKPHDPTKGEEGFGKAVRNWGGEVASLSDLLSADGIFDPIRFAARPQDGISTAASLLGSINPWGSNRADMEVSVRHALQYGVSEGATCIGQALQIAQDAGEAPASLVQEVFRAADSDPAMRAMIGMHPQGDGLRVSNRLTLIEAGSFQLDLPSPGADPASLETPLSQRVTSGLVRMMVQGSAMALTGRDGVVMLDEAWMFLSAGFSEVERLGRLARSQRVLPILATQRVTDALNAGLAGYISRGLILPLEEAEANAACALFKVEATPELIKRLAGKAWNGSTPNWSSFRALWDRKGPGRRNLRGTLGLYVDLEDRVAPVEIALPPAFLQSVSTNSLDVDARRAAAAAAASTGN